MKKLLISVEGQTEEQFIKRILQKLFPESSCFLQPVRLETRRDPSGLTYKGGILSYARIRKEIKKLLSDTSACAVSTMYDYYGLPQDFPGMKSLQPQWNAIQKVLHLEQAFAQDINDVRFVPYLSLHEFEALLLSNIPEVVNYFKSKGVQNLSSIQQLASHNPEDVNTNNPPSRRLENAYPSYRKLSDGIILAERIGIDNILNRCPHFQSWVQKLQQMCSNC